jgi:hypothetical protein
LLALGLVTTSAFSATVSYHFSTGATAAVGASHLVALLSDSGNLPVVSGSFRYNTDAPLFGLSDTLGGEPGFAVYVGNASALAFSSIQGKVAGLSFSDPYGSVNIGNNHAQYGGADVLSLTADPLTAGFARQLQGFTLGDYTLRNVRMSWAAPSSFLADSTLPKQLPAFFGTLALDFVLTSDPLGPTLTGNTVSFHGVTVQAVPEPSTVALMLGGLGWLAARTWRRQTTRPHH